ncbi:MAG: MGMT family protein [Firmicutes bacterium]|nr:MGMT family protein [Bacillota bacterium]
MTTYGALARMAGGSPRSVGGALGANPVAILVPCHRVVAAGGGLGGYSGGLRIKERLLALEGIRLPA